MKDKYIPIKDASKQCDVTICGIYQRVRRGKIRGRKVGWVWLVHQDDIKKLKSNHRTIII